ncbi:hypothetical protein [Ferrimonas balearica]|uniref:hypothetical protein n=1 Tax=Ferrimonas balearica TaxID=44012 RepID=UPI001C98FD05|nr:hypothetical protein [Ferrimonas balearica]MBY5922262.1 hypothetical protein [Ferrimonas balearica]MBY5994398.1 hypothetical protein [Ferrimonas balearica]
MSFRDVKVFLAVLALIFVSSCGREEMMGVDEINEAIGNNLSAGDAAERIESFLISKEIDFTYDKYSRRYQCIKRSNSENDKIESAIIIYIYVDSNKRFVSSEVIESYTMP